MGLNIASLVMGMLGDKGSMTSLGNVLQGALDKFAGKMNKDEALFAVASADKTKMRIVRGTYVLHEDGTATFTRTGDLKVVELLTGLDVSKLNTAAIEKELKG